MLENQNITRMKKLITLTQLEDIQSWVEEQTNRQEGSRAFVCMPVKDLEEIQRMLQEIKISIL